MTGLSPALAGYLDLRRGLGFKLDRDAKLLDQFITYLEQRGTGTVTVTDALAWATLPADASPGWLRMRMTVVRGFAAYLATLDPSAEVPPASPALLVSSAGTRLFYYNVGQTFARLARQARLPSRSGNCRPRPHDLRH